MPKKPPWATLTPSEPALTSLSTCLCTCHENWYIITKNVSFKQSYRPRMCIHSHDRQLKTPLIPSGPL